MKRKVISLISLVALLCAIGAGYLGWRSWRTARAATALREVVRSADLGAIIDASRDDAAGAVDLALRGVDLAQGEGGKETWRLHADWATLRQESGLVEVREPQVRYALDENGGDRFVLASSDMGRVTDENTRVLMEGNVRAAHEDDVLKGPLAVFDNNTRVLTFPQGAELSGPVLAGRANVLRWSMITNTLEGRDGVDVTWTPDTAATPPNLHPADSPARTSGGPMETNP